VILIYGLVAILFMYLFWPYLWSAPIPKFIEAITYMTNFPWNETVLFNGARYKANFLPPDYLPRSVGAIHGNQHIVGVFWSNNCWYTDLKKTIKTSGMVPSAILVFCTDSNYHALTYADL
jgi:hypothetical protein